MRPSALFKVLPPLIEAGESIVLSAPPGVGKTAILKQIHEEVLHRRLFIFHPAISDPTDFRGMAWVKDGRATFIPFDEILNALECSEPCTLFFDDLGQAPPSIQTAVAQWAHKDGRVLNGMALPYGSSMVFATNRRQDRAGVNGFLEHFKSRCILMEMEPSVEDFVSYALKKKFDPILIAFLKYRGAKLLFELTPNTELVNSPSPRTWEALNRVLGTKVPDEYLNEVANGTVGKPAATEFFGFRRIMAKLPPVGKIPTKPDDVVVPEDPAVCYAMTVALADMTNEGNVTNIFRYIRRMNQEHQVIYTQMMISRNPKLAETGEYTKWAVDNQGAY